MTRTLNVAMIGGGFMGKAHALAYAAMPMFFWPAPAIPRRKVIVDVTPDLAETARQRFGFEEASADWKAVLSRNDIDVVDIVTPNDSHAEIAIAAAPGGQEYHLREAARAHRHRSQVACSTPSNAAGVIHMVAFNYRRTPAVALARKYIEEGRVGNILSFRGTYLQDWSADPNGPLSWRFQKKIAGSGAVGDIGTHVIDLARYLVGEITAVNALVKTYIATPPGAIGRVRSACCVRQERQGPARGGRRRRRNADAGQIRRRRDGIDRGHPQRLWP